MEQRLRQASHRPSARSSIANGYLNQYDEILLPVETLPILSPQIIEEPLIWLPRGRSPRQNIYEALDEDFQERFEAQITKINGLASKATLVIGNQRHESDENTPDGYSSFLRRNSSRTRGGNPGRLPVPSISEWNRLRDFAGNSRPVDARLRSFQKARTMDDLLSNVFTETSANINSVVLLSAPDYFDQETAAAADQPSDCRPSTAGNDALDMISLPTAALQRVMDLVSELVLTRNQIMELSRQSGSGQIKGSLERLSAVTSDLRDAVMRAQMQPMARLFACVPGLIRDLSAELEKKFDLVIEGADTALAPKLIEALRDPLIHLIRNCANHGIESPLERIAAGKPEAGRISISAFCNSGEVTIEVADDGRSLDGDGLGRSMGMEDIRARIEGIGGTISLQSEKGHGSKFILKIPLMFAIAPALIVKAGGQRFAVPQHYLERAVSLDEETQNLKTMDNVHILRIRDELIPAVSLSKVLDLPDTGGMEDKLVIVLGLSGQKLGVIVDEIGDIQDIVVKPLGPLFSSLRMFSGSTILGDDTVILIIDPAGIAAAADIQKASDILPSPSMRTSNAATPSSLLLFKAGAGAPKVLPRSAVSRILQVPAQDLSQDGDVYLYRYQERPIPVLRVAEAGEKAGACLILVIVLYNQTFGLWVDSVLDIVESQTEIQLISSSPALLGTATLRGGTVEFIDAGYYYRMAFQEARGPAAAKAELLIVDGEPGMHELLKPLLTSAGHKVTAVETADEANELLQHRTFGVILLDAKAASSIDEAALSRQPDALCLIFNDDRNEGASETSISKLDRHRLLKAIDCHLGQLPGSEQKAANLNLPDKASIAGSL